MQDASPDVAAATAGYWKNGITPVCLSQSLMAVMVVSEYGCLFVRRAESQDMLLG